MHEREIAELRQLDLAHHLSVNHDYKALIARGGARIVTRGAGSTLIDAEGCARLDGMAGLWCVNVGYGREELARAAYDQMVELPFYHTFFGSVAPPTVRLAAKLGECMGGSLQHVFFNNSGSEAVDTAIRMVRYYWQSKGQPDRNILIARVNGYHGSTVGGVSLGGMEAMRGQGGPLMPGVEHVMQPYGFGDGFGEDSRAFGERAADALETRILELGPEKVAAFIGEPVQGSGGVIIPPENYWRRVESICRKYGVLLISDEVICGFGRLGSWFGFQHFGFTPDFVTMAKGLSSGYVPISAVGVADHVVETIRKARAPFAHGFTYSGHPTAAAVALKNLEIIEREGLVARTAEETGPYLAQALASLADHPLVGEVRSVGLIGAIELVSTKGTNERFAAKPPAAFILRDLCDRLGLIVRAGRDTIYLSPPLVITLPEIDRMVGILRQGLDEAEPVLRKAQVPA